MNDARTAAQRLTAWLDALGLLALASTGELGQLPWVGASAMLALALLLPLRARPRESVLFALMLAVVLGAVASAIFLPVLPLVVAAWATPLLHSLLWHAPRTPTYRGWRIGLGFAELILASALTNEVILPILVFLFVVIASVAISCSFLERELARQSPTPGQVPLPQGFIRRTLLQALGIFLTAAILFPILPRVEGENSGRWEGGRVGYNEEVSLREWTRLSGQSGGRVALRLYQPTGDSLLKRIPQGLVRGRALELFDGRTWMITTTHPEGAPHGERAPDPETSPWIEAVREPIATDILPVPYGTTEVRLQGAEGEWSPPPSRSGEFSEKRLRDHRVPFQLRLPSGAGPRYPQDAVLPLHRKLPLSVWSARLERLARTVFAQARTDAEKVEALLRYFRRESFKPAREARSEIPDEALSQSHLPPLEEFLFIRKEGNCELFASSSALLLRWAGVPTRLVAGFKVTKPPVGGVLSLRSSDAHAWVEAYVTGQGWRPIDPTPRIAAPFSPMELARDLYDVLSGLWWRTVLAYAPAAEDAGGRTAWQRLSLAKGRTSSPRGSSQAMALIALAALLAAGLAVWLTRRSTRRPRERRLDGPAVLAAERRRWQKLLQRDALSQRKMEPQIRELMRQWESRYQALRFGPPTTPLGNAAKNLAETRLKLVRVLDKKASPLHPRS